ncbi:hypothetical protein HERIO_1299 [Hepatospora eriocheir]|uniref:Uncharacterized protein n=1 Tax=Hepatospora eriocheir TaxID=1081669 RepID=A0A1X0QAH5_9MICR|nr:hypothetical protein HERIO_1299 [Hepatospora eriocheir]
MNIVIEPFTILLSAFAISMNIFLFGYFIHKRIALTSHQIKLQIYTLIFFILYLSYFISLLIKSYNQQVWEYDLSEYFKSSKKLQILTESFLKGLVILIFNLFVLGLSELDTLFINESKITKIVTIGYFLLRMYPIGVIITKVKSDYELAITFYESFAIAESGILLLGFIFLLNRFLHVDSELIENNIIDRFALQKLINKLKMICKIILFGLIGDIVYRIILIFLASKDKTNNLLLLKDFTLFLRISSFESIIIGSQLACFLPLTNSKNVLTMIRDALNEKKDLLKDLFEYSTTRMEDSTYDDTKTENN